MPYYMIQAAYTAEAGAAMVKNPQDRIATVTPAFEKLGGKVVGGWHSFGEYDVIVIGEMPDNVSAASFSLAASAGGALKAIKTTPLITTAEMMEAMRKASGAGYKPPA